MRTRRASGVVQITLAGDVLRNLLLKVVLVCPHIKTLGAFMFALSLDDHRVRNFVTYNTIRLTI